MSDHFTPPEKDPVTQMREAVQRGEISEEAATRALLAYGAGGGGGPVSYAVASSPGMGGGVPGPRMFSEGGERVLPEGITVADVRALYTLAARLAHRCDGEFPPDRYGGTCEDQLNAAFRAPEEWTSDK